MTHLIWFICIGWVGIHAEWRATQQFPVLYWLYIIYHMFNRILYIIYCYNYNLFDPTDLFCNFLHFSCRISVKHHDLAKMWSHCWRSQIWIFHIMCRDNTVMFWGYRCFCILVIKCKNLLMSIMFLLHLKKMFNSAAIERLKSRTLPMWCMTIFGGGSHQAKRSEREVTVFSDQQRKQDRDDEGGSD